MMFTGCRPPRYDIRDYKLKSAVVDTSSLPTVYDPSPKVGVKDQGSVSSCVAHAVSSILEWHSLPHRRLSTNFIYGLQKYLCNREGKGMYLRDACKIASEYGDMLEIHCSGNTEVPGCYSIAEETLAHDEKVNKAYEYHIESYYTCSSESEIKYALVNHGPVLASLKWYHNYKVNNDGVLSCTGEGEYGYHAFMIYGYNDKGYLCQNSWGSSWGSKGRFILPYSTKLAEVIGIVDYENEDIAKPATNAFLNIIYKIINFIFNLFKSK